MKKQALKFLAVTCLIGISMIWYACQTDSDLIGEGEVSINVLTMNTSSLKSSSINDLNDAQKVIITVQEYDGSATDYTQYELDIYKMGDAFITKKIVLPFGDYQVAEFYIIDALDSIIYASPLEGSLMAQNVTDPLPLLFNVNEKQSKAVDVEVVSTEKLKPEDFGLIRFPIIDVETFQFLINVSELGTDQLLIADLTVTSGSYSYAQNLDSIIDNIVTIKDGFQDYILTIENTGYQTYVDTLTNSELKMYDSAPFVTELGITTEGLVAYYPFNGNANDESSNGYHGTVYGATLTTDRNGYSNSAYSFESINDYISVSDSYTDLKIIPPLTISVWVYFRNITNNSMILHKGDAIYRYYKMQVINGKLDVNCEGYSARATSTDNIITGTWYNFVFVHDDLNIMLYINGVLDASVSSTSTGTYSSSQPLLFSNSDPSTFIDGIIDDSRFYNRVLTELEIQALYNE